MGLAALIVSVCSVLLSVWTFITNRVDARSADARAVTVHETFVTGILSETNHPELIVRNDGTRAVTVVTFGIAYGPDHVVDRNRPTYWALQRVAGGVLLAPGADLREATPDPVTGVGVIGPLAFISDGRGQPWQITQHSRVRLVPEDARWRPLDRAWSRWPWLRRLDERIETRQIRKRESRPGALPVVPVIVDSLWGWRAGRGTKALVPRGAPLAWRYANSTPTAEMPDVPALPTYGWRREGDPT